MVLGANLREDRAGEDPEISLELDSKGVESLSRARPVRAARPGLGREGHLRAATCAG